MTEAGYEWFKLTCLNAKYVPDGAQTREVAEFWITVFHSTVLKKARDRCKHAIPSHPACFGCMGIEFRRLANDTREMP